LAPFIEDYWTVSWDLPAALVHGVPTRRFEVELAGRGRVFGAKFRPGGFAASQGLSPARYADQRKAAGTDAGLRGSR